MTHRRRDRPWRVTVDSLSTDHAFRVRKPEDGPFRGRVEPRLWHTWAAAQGPNTAAPSRQCPRRRDGPGLNPHRRRPPGGSVQSLVSEVPTRPFVKASLCLRHS